MERVFFYCAMKFAAVRFAGAGVKAKVKGDLVENGRDASGHNLGNSTNVIEGLVFQIPKTLLEVIDDMMGPTARRISIKTLDNKKAWVYEALTDCPKNAPRLNKWPNAKQLGHWMGGARQ